MKNFTFALLLLLWGFYAAPIQGQDMLYAKVGIDLHIPDALKKMTLAGLPVDHYEKIESHRIALIFSEEELLQLGPLGITYEVIVPDMQAYYQQLLQGPNAARTSDCGLNHFDEGNMGGYHTYAQVTAHLNMMKSEFPDLVALYDIGTTIEGRVIKGAKISDQAASDESATEAAVYFDALTHAREPMSLESTLYYMWWLLENYGSNPEAAYLVNNRQIYFVPIVNPDGYVYNESIEPNGGGLWRKNRRDSGNNCFGVDLNRNYGTGWGLDSGSSSDPCSNIYRGTAAFSEAESAAVRDFLQSTNASIAFASHTYGDKLLSPFGYTDSLASYEIYAEFVSEFIPRSYDGYGTTAKMLNYTSSGTTRDYFHSQGVYAWTPEIGHEFWEPASVICDRVNEFLPTMKYLTWVSGNYACYHDFQLQDAEQIWQGDTIALDVRVKNRGLSQTAENVVVTLRSIHPALSPIENSHNYGAIAARQFQDNGNSPFRFYVQNVLTVGEQVAIQVEVMQSGSISYLDTLYLNAGLTTVLAKDDSETGIDQWTTNGVQLWDTTFMDAVSGFSSIADSRYGNYLANSETTITFNQSIDLTEVENPWLEYNAKWSFENFFDFAYAEMSLNGSPIWLPMEGQHTVFSNGTPAYTQNRHWVQERIDLRGLIGESDVRFRFRILADGGVHSDGFYFDDFRVVDYAEPIIISTEEPRLPLGSLAIYPNPTKGSLYLQFEAREAAEANVALYDLMGNRILEEQFTGALGVNDYQLQLDEFVPAMYWLVLTYQGQREVRRLIRMK